MRILSLTALFLMAALCSAAPALAEKPPRWEYAELIFRTIPARAGGVGADGVEVPATPASVAIRWITGSGEVEGKGWADLAEKLKASGFKKEGTAAFHKIQILNHLGSDGWELMEQQGATGTMSGAVFGPDGRRATTTAASTWLLKRRVP
jgi:hypothetical protein